MRSVFLTAMILACFLLLAKCPRNSNQNVDDFTEPPRPSSPPEEVRALSLKVLQARLRACQPKNSCSPELLRLSGMNVVLGFVVDQANQDLILLGQSDSTLPPLHLEDFVVALRNAWMKYAPLEGNTYQYSYPGCSIDPVPEVMRELQLVEQQLDSRRSTGEMERALDSWRRVCQKPQAVRVLGIPFDTHFAQVMVKADYDMKTLADGADAIGIPGFISMTEMSLGEARQAIQQNKTITLSASLNRFWFYPGETSFEEAQGESQNVLFLKRCPVKLLTEQMYSDARGQTIQSGMANPQAERFAENFTALYDRVMRQRPIYQELENLFRFVALAKLIEERKANGIDLSYLLEGFVVTAAPVAKTLPGRHLVKTLEHQEESQQSIRTLRLWFPSCGGVGIEIEPKVERDSTELLSALGANAVKTRSSKETLSWSFKDDDYALREKKDNARLHTINQFNKTNRALTVTYKPEGYLVNDGDSEPIFIGSNLAELGKRLRAKYGESSIETFLVETKDFPGDHKKQAFWTTYRMQNPESDTPWKLKALSDGRDGPTDLQNRLMNPGVSYNQKESKVGLVSEGERKGWVKVTLGFFVQVGKNIYRVVVHYFITGAELIRNLDLGRAFQAEVDTYFAVPDFKAESLLDSLNEIERTFKRKHPDAQIEKEFEGIQISQFVSAVERDAAS
ncbi:MAG: DUF1598 domain-containing protein [Acidobacteriota bacterium]|nr:DUF1598 domain-containing protein [Acidobacteriota bacterium]